MKYVESILRFLLASLFIVAPVAAEEMPALRNLVEKRLRNCNCSAVLVKTDDGKILASLNADPILKESHPPGSLMKVFTLIAYAQTHSAFPEFQCPPSLARDPQGCWDRNGHGTVNAQKALAVSCNVYFRQLAAQTSPEVFERVAREFGILEQCEDWKDQQTIRNLMTGTTLDWSVPPIRLLRAYCSFFHGVSLWSMPGSNPEAQIFALPPELRNLIRNGLREGSYHGTSTEARLQAGVPMLGKTGTSLILVNGRVDYSHTQGWWIGLYPEDDPEVAIMTFVRNGRGATDAAPNGGRALAAWLEYTKRLQDPRYTIQDARR